MAQNFGARQAKLLPYGSPGNWTSQLPPCHWTNSTSSQLISAESPNQQEFQVYWLSGWELWSSWSGGGQCPYTPEPFGSPTTSHTCPHLKLISPFYSSYSSSPDTSKFHNIDSPTGAHQIRQESNRGQLSSINKNSKTEGSTSNSKPSDRASWLHGETVQSSQIFFCWTIFDNHISFLVVTSNIKQIILHLLSGETWDRGNGYRMEGRLHWW